MSANVNTVVIAGNLTANPVMSAVKSGYLAANFSVAINEKNKDQERTSFIPVTVWGKLATICERYLAKGSAVLVEGRLKSEEYERQGVKIRTMRVIADQIHFLNKNNGAGNVNSAAPAAPSFNPPPTGGNGWQVDDSDLPM